MNRPVAVQLYSIRHDFEKDPRHVFETLAEQGYDGVEFAGLYHHGPEGIGKLLREYKLKSEGCHVGIEAFSDELFSSTIETYQALGCHWLILAWLPEPMRNTPTACAETGRKLGELCHRLHEQGMRVGFHCHHADMTPLSDGISAWYHIAKNTPASFIMQYDTANGMSGGADPVKPITDLPGRGASVHLKEWKGGHGAVIGEGQVPWTKVLRECEAVGGTEWYVVEYEIESDPEPLQSVGKCLKYLRNLEY